MKVAIVGSGRTRVEAPFYDDGWAVEGVGTFPLPRCTVWYEVHDPVKVIGSYHAMLQSMGVVWCADPMVAVVLGAPARLMDMPAMEARFGTEFLSSSVSIAMAWSIMRGASAIGLWGVEQSLKGVYEDQRPGTLHFIHLCRELGIDVVMPDDCPLRFERGRYPNRDVVR
jgi:hypothetical protein